MLYLLDTNTISRLALREPKVLARAAAIGETDEAVTCTIVRGEVLYGIEHLPKGRRRDETNRLMQAVFQQIRCVPAPDLAAEGYAMMNESRQRAGRKIEENDLWISVTAMAIGAVLVSHDKDVQVTAGLVVEDWW
jgi:tRNA(fMet)-specific endonuclease VapC